MQGVNIRGSRVGEIWKPYYFCILSLSLKGNWKFKKICLINTSLKKIVEHTDVWTQILTLKVVSSYVPKSEKNTSGLTWWNSGLKSARQWTGHGFNPSSRKIPHGTVQLSLHTITREKPVRHNEDPAWRN